jgi:uncharacterized protein (DUF433 family)
MNTQKIPRLTKPVAEQQQHAAFNKYRDALIRHRTANGWSVDELCTEFSMMPDEIMAALHAGAIAQEHEKFRCNMINYRATHGIAHDDIAREFSMTEAEVELALTKHAIFSNGHKTY